MKKVMVSLAILVMFVFLVGCLDYKAYDISSDEETVDELSLVDEIAEIERQLAEIEEEEEETVEEEVVAPELDEEVTETNVQVITVKENELVKLNLKVNDPDQDEVTYTFTKPLSSLGEWQTNFGDAGEYMVTIAATDGVLTSEKKVKIVVERVNVPPVISPLKDIIVKEGAEVKFEPVVSDPNGDPVTVGVSEPLKSGFFSTDHTSAGEYQIKVVASDGELETEKTFTLTINDVNMLPELSGLEDLVVMEGDTVTIAPEVTDLDGDEVVLTISEPVGDDGVWDTSYTDHGVYEVTVVANDGKSTVTEKVTLTVEDVNMPPEIVEVSLLVN